MRGRALPVLFAVVLATTGCASGRSSAPRKHYSVAEVKHAFATQGIDLTSFRPRLSDVHSKYHLSAAVRKHILRELGEESRGTVVLHAGRLPDAVLVEVEVKASSLPLRFSFVNGVPAPDSERFTRSGNVVVVFDEKRRPAIDAALARLR